MRRFLALADVSASSARISIPKIFGQQARTLAAASASGGRKKKLLSFKKRRGPFLTPHDALQQLQAGSKAKFDETVEMVLQLGVDPRKPNQNIRGVVQLPHGTGKKVTVAVFARGPKAEEAQAAGADVVGAEDLVERVLAGEIPFSKCIATPDAMPLVGRVARILGPRGLMPNPKVGTVTMDVASAVKAAKRGQVQFRTEKRGQLMMPLGKVSFERSQLLENMRAVMLAVSDMKPPAMKGQYLRWAVLSTTMGKGLDVELQRVDPNSARFMRDD